MTTSSTTTASPSSETSKQKTTKANDPVFVSILARSFSLGPSSLDDTVGKSLAYSFINMNDEDRAQTINFLKDVPNIAKIFGYYLQIKIVDIDDSRENTIRMLRDSRYHELSKKVPQEISDDVRKEIENLEKENENVKRGMAEGKRYMYKDSFK
ncbi:MAG: hypothetical protein M1125_02095 [Candidatus Marsarchaeota archaeon]|nr:hypothetical protein [Candidatus Marsarchaeota archaeon]